MLTQDFLVGLSKQVFILDYLLNGLFPCQSDIVKLIRGKKKEWAFNDKFEYRMFLSHTNTGGTLNSQTFNENVSLAKPGSIEIGTFFATYGSVSDGFSVDMTANLETENKRAAFENDFAVRMHSLRMNVASLYKNFAISGRFGVVHQIHGSIEAPKIPASRNPKPNVMNATDKPVVGEPFTIKVPINVFNSNFKRGKYLIKTTEAAPWGAALTRELYMVLENQPGTLTLLPCGKETTAWESGQFLEVANNREINGRPLNPFSSANWQSGALVVNAGPWAGAYDQYAPTFANTADPGYTTYTTGATPSSAITGAMEGLADLFPWYTETEVDADGNVVNSLGRLGMDLPFRGQKNRLVYSVEQGGSFVLQNPGEHIIDAIMRGVFLTKSTVSYGDVQIYMNPYTRAEMGYEEAGDVKVIRDNLIAGPIVYQRGVKETHWQVGPHDLSMVVEDPNLPTDVILIGPRLDISYNTWDNTMFQIDDYIQETWAGNPPPNIDDLAIPDELVTKLDISNRITYGAPTLADSMHTPDFAGSSIRHPQNLLPIALHEMGALFTENPYCYTVVKLLQPITELKTA